MSYYNDSNGQYQNRQPESPHRSIPDNSDNLNHGQKYEPHQQSYPQKYNQPPYPYGNGQVPRPQNGFPSYNQPYPLQPHYPSGMPSVKDEYSAKSSTSYNIATSNKPAPQGWLVSAYSWIEVLATAWIIVVLFCTFFLRTVGVKGSSMNPTLSHDDKIIVTSMFYTPKRGDIVIIMPTEKMQEAIVKRVIALPGEEVEISHRTEGKVYINKELLEPENYVKQIIHLEDGEDYRFTVPEGCVFVLGDNRNNSIDSRSLRVGMVDTRYIIGKAIFRVMPNMEMFKSPDYVGG